MWMMTAVLMFSVLPLAFAWAEAMESPFLFGAGLRAGQCVGVLLCLAVMAPAWGPAADVCRVLWKRMRAPGFPWVRGDVLLVAVSFLEYGLMIQAARFVELPVAVILLETWPVLFLVLARSLFRGRNRFMRIGLSGWAALGLGLAGMVAVTLSKTGPGMSGASGAVFAGAALAVGAALALSLSGFGFRWAAELADAWPGTGRSRADTELLGVLAISVPGTAVAAALQFVAGAAMGEEIGVDRAGSAVAVGLVLATCAGVAWRKAMVLTEDLAVNAMLYSAPLLSLAWVHWAGMLGRVDVPWLAAGAVALVSANMVLARRGRQALVRTGPGDCRRS